MPPKLAAENTSTLDTGCQNSTLRITSHSLVYLGTPHEREIYGFFCTIGVQIKAEVSWYQ
jgi:hypothetical protein